MNLTVKQKTFINKLLESNGHCRAGLTEQNIESCKDCILKQYGLSTNVCDNIIALEIAIKINNELSQKLHENSEIQFFL